MNNLKITERRIETVTILDLDGNIRLGEGSSDLRTALRLLVEKERRKFFWTWMASRTSIRAA